METLSLRILRTVKTTPLPVDESLIGGPVTMVKGQIEEKLQWQTVEPLGDTFIETDWCDVPIVTYDADIDKYI